MNRMTVWDEFDNADIIGVDLQDSLMGLKFNELGRVTLALNKLAEYEDISPDPDHIRAELGELERLRKERTEPSWPNPVDCGRSDCELRGWECPEGCSVCKCAQCKHGKCIVVADFGGDNKKAKSALDGQKE